MRQKQRPHGTSLEAGTVRSLKPTLTDRCPKVSFSVKTFLMNTRRIAPKGISSDVVPMNRLQEKVMVGAQISPSF